MSNERVFCIASILTGLLLSACGSQPPVEAPASSIVPAAPVVAAAGGDSEAAEQITGEAKVVTAIAALPSDDDVVCTVERGVTGTHFKREVCMTREQRRRQRTESQDWARSGGRRGGISAVPTVR